MQLRIDAADYDFSVVLQQPSPNIQKKTYFVPSLGRKVTLTLSAKGIKVIDARGIEAVVADLKKRGVKF